jgi:dTDP-4-amino-4,6-dideoxygalactose transaminase
MNRIYLSPPHLDGREKQLMVEALESNWITTLGPQVDAFEREMAAKLGVAHAAAVSSGTAALHLSLVIAGVRPGDEVLCSDFTFAATANAITYCGATPVFIDSSESTWNMDPALLEAELEACRKRGKMPRAAIVVDLYGQCADYRPILDICNRYEIPVIEDAAEALGATYGGNAAGSMGIMGILSFNGNKIITTSGGGMLLSNNEEFVSRARFLATQARDPAPHYQHSSIGFNYRMSNLLAAVGRGQLENLERKVERRRAINGFYRTALREFPGIAFMPEASYGRSNCWLTCILVDSSVSGITPEIIRRHLEGRNIESRPLWKPMHMQPVFRSCRMVGGAVSERLFGAGLCLPSGSGLSGDDLDRIVSAVKEVPSLPAATTRQ